MPRYPQVLVDSAPGHQETTKPPSAGFSLSVCFGSLAVAHKKIIRACLLLESPDRGG